VSKADALVEIRRLAYNVEESAAALGIDKDRMGGLVRVGRVPHMLVGGRVLIGIAALEQWLSQECMANVRQPRAEETAAVRRIGRKTGAA
jgi:hypothetical protein